LIAFCHDLFMAAASFLASAYLRLGEDVAFQFGDRLWLGAALFTVVAGAAFWVSGLYRGVWRYASTTDLLALGRAVTLAILAFGLLMFLVTRLEGVPRSVLLINWFILIIALGGPRLTYRVFKDGGFGQILDRSRRLRMPVLLIGAEDGAELFIREMARDRDPTYRVVGIIDDKGGRVGRRIHGVSVLGDLAALPLVLRRLKTRGTVPQKLVVTRGDLPAAQLRAVMAVAEAEGLALARLPSLTALQSGAAAAIQPIPIEDLLGRPQAVLDRPAMGRWIAGRRVLVTGAGGSIGSELVRQIAGLGPAQITLFDAAEYLLYEIDLAVASSHPDLPRAAVLGNVRDQATVRRAISDHRPDLVFHAAALKHVPLVEHNATEGLLTNVIGSRVVADACADAGISAMVLISTDKAINPTNVMGASKRLAEMYCQALDVRPDVATRFVTVRFGNVLGSTGSVVPLFERQIARGGPVTVTDPDITRYFMTIREAVELVLQASALRLAAGEDAESIDPGSLFALDMGEPVRIADLAEQMIRLAGLRPGRDIEIAYTGLRPGEKLHEELFHAGEDLLPTRAPGILLGRPRALPLGDLRSVLDDLASVAAAGERAQALALLHDLVPEFDPPSGAPRRAAE